jgi:phenylacetic acid degradation operon negative regulatory protein
MRVQERRTHSSGPCRHRDLAPAMQLRLAIEVAVEFDRAAQPDPLLPPQLLPQPWPGTEGRKLAARCWARLAAEDGHRHRIFAHYDQAVIG